MNKDPSFIRKLLRSRFRPKPEVRKLIEKEEKQLHSKKLPSYIQGTYNGNFYRVKVPKRKLLPDVPKLPTSRPAPKAFKSVSSERAETVKKGKYAVEDFLEQMKQWLLKNWSVLLFNAGSVCTLIGFTRSDVLELRVFSVAGSLTGLIYNIIEVRKIAPAIWGAMFVSINAWKISEILTERRATVHLSAKQEDMYVKHFLPHGVTPKQFEHIYNAANIEHLKLGEQLIRQNEVHKYVYLVVEGCTSATALGRYMTAASVKPEHFDKQGGASGAWVGEMAFLEYLWRRHTPVDPPIEGDDKEGEDSDTPAKQKSQLKSDRALFTITAKEDCVLLRWKFEDMEKLMERSTDMRSALTRAMASAVVGKVINFTVSGSKNPWSAWLGDWKTSDGARIEVGDEEASREEDHHDEEKLPAAPGIRKFSKS